MIRVINKYGNVSLDTLTDMLDSTSVVSEGFKIRIQTIIDLVGTIGYRDPETAKEQIGFLKEDMERLLLFSEKFISFVCLRLQAGLELEIKKILPVETATRVCAKCGQDKPIEEYTFSRKTRRNKNGTVVEGVYPGPYCRPCHRVVNKANKEKRSKEELAAYHKEYWKNYKRKPKGMPREGAITEEEIRKYAKKK